MVSPLEIRFNHLLNLNGFNFFIKSICVFECVFVGFSAVFLRSQKDSDPLELELQGILSYLIWVPRSFCQKNVYLTTESTLQPKGKFSSFKMSQGIC